MPDSKDFVLRRKLSEVTGHYISFKFIGRITGLSRRAMYYRMTGEFKFKDDEIDKIHAFFEPYGVTKRDILEWIEQDLNGRTN